MASRLVEDNGLRTTAESQVSVSINFLDSGIVGGDGQSGKNFIRYEYMARAGRGETVRYVVTDPFYSMINPAMIDPSKSYFGKSRKEAPVNFYSHMYWAGDDELKSPGSNHVLAGLAPYESTSDVTGIEFLGIDYASWHLSAGDAGGHSYEGTIKQVIEQVVDRYSRGQLTVDFKTKTLDNEKNRWWQNRMSPKEFILSLLNWSSSITDKKTQWLIYPDDEKNPAKLIITEQAGLQSKNRATYYMKSSNDDSSSMSDVQKWDMVGDNALQLFNHKIVTSGISTTSGAYFDRNTPVDVAETIVGDAETTNKYVPEATKRNAFTKPPNDAKPEDNSIGHFHVLSIPEHNAGDLGIKYNDYISGNARGVYLNSQSELCRCVFTINGHHIWSGSEGLGCDTINIVMQAAEKEPHFLKGYWIVDGYHHILTRRSWVTKLYCYRMDHDAQGKRVGKG